MSIALENLDYFIKNGLVDENMVRRKGGDWMDGFYAGHEAALSRLKFELEDLQNEMKNNPVQAIVMSPELFEKERERWKKRGYSLEKLDKEDKEENETTE